MPAANTLASKITASTLQAAPELQPALEECKTFIGEFARRYVVDISFCALRAGRNTGVMQPSGLVVIGANMLKALSGPTMKFVMAHEASHAWVEQRLVKQKGVEVLRGYRYNVQALVVALVLTGVAYALGWWHLPVAAKVARTLVLAPLAYAAWDLSHSTGYLWNEVQADWGAAVACGSQEAIAAMEELMVFAGSRGGLSKRLEYLKELAGQQQRGEKLRVTIKGKTFPVHTPTLLP